LSIRLIIQTIGLEPSGAVWTDEAANVSRRDPSGACWVDAEHPARTRTVQGFEFDSGLLPWRSRHADANDVTL
jgi:hypothetical protein